MSADELADALATSVDDARSIRHCLAVFAAPSPPQSIEATPLSSERAPAMQDTLLGTGEPALVIHTPVEGETVLLASVSFDVRHVPRWQECCVVEVLLDTTEPGLLEPVAAVGDPALLPVQVDPSCPSLVWNPLLRGVPIWS